MLVHLLPIIALKRRGINHIFRTLADIRLQKPAKQICHCQCRPYSRHLGDCIKSMAQLQAKLMWNRGLWEPFAMVKGGGEECGGVKLLSFSHPSFSISL